ncbi:hypothetical protein [Nonomuraea sp. KM90]|uniref:hypothetical protein n=1 Tax=Nonomuraea sp. KM90 TaxID=3457428 RepID=UPI003FCE2ADD
MHKLLPSEAAYWKAITTLLLERLERARADPEGGAMSAEAMIIIAALVLVAVTVMAVVTAKIVNKANSIDF